MSACHVIRSRFCMTPKLLLLLLSCCCFFLSPNSSTSLTSNFQINFFTFFCILYSRLEVIDEGKKTIGFVKSQQLSSVVPFQHERINQRDEHVMREVYLTIVKNITIFFKNMPLYFMDPAAKTKPLYNALHNKGWPHGHVLTICRNEPLGMTVQ